MWTAQVEVDSDDNAILFFPEEMSRQLGWKPGDTLIWEQQNDEWILRKDENSSTE